MNFIHHHHHLILGIYIVWCLTMAGVAYAFDLAFWQKTWPDFAYEARTRDSWVAVGAAVLSGITAGGTFLVDFLGIYKRGQTGMMFTTTETKSNHIMNILKGDASGVYANYQVGVAVQASPNSAPPSGAIGGRGTP